MTKRRWKQTRCVDCLAQRAGFYIGKPHKFNSALKPNLDYLKLCVNAAGEWGEAFRETFRKTTFVSDTPLAEVPGLTDA